LLALALVGELVRGLGPSANKPAPVVVAEAERVGTRQGNNLLVVEPHAVEHVSEVLGTKSGVGKATIGSHALERRESESKGACVGSKSGA